MKTKRLGWSAAYLLHELDADGFSIKEIIRILECALETAKRWEAEE